MPGVGDVITPRLTVSPADNTTAATLVVRHPDGTSTPGAGETGSSGNAVWTADAVPLTAPGVWVLDWTVSGTGASAEPEYVIVSPAATPAEMPETLATIADLVAELGRPLTATELARAPGLLASASTKIRGYCRRTFATAADAVIVLRPIGTTLRLPQRPVTAVTSVAVVGTGGTADRVLGAGEWAWDGADKIELWPCPSLVIGTVPPAGTYANTYRVVYDYGTGVPELIRDLCRDATLRTLTSPTMVAGLVQERIGQYGYQFGQGSGDQSPGASVKLSDDDKQLLREAGYRRTAGTIQLRAS